MIEDMSYRILITTSDAYVKLCPGFAHQWNKYCALPVTLVWRNIEPSPLPDNFTLLQAPTRWHDWSGSLIQALNQVNDDVILVGLEDFWLSERAAPTYLEYCAQYILDNPDVMRIDLTEDRLGYPHARVDDFYQAVIDPAQVQYLCSSQYSLWRRSFLLHALVPGELPPHFEVEGSRRVASEYPRILGTGWRPLPCSGDGVVWNGVLDNLHMEYLSPNDIAELIAKGLLA